MNRFLNTETNNNKRWQQRKACFIHSANNALAAFPFYKNRILNLRVVYRATSVMPVLNYFGTRVGNLNYV